MPKELKPIDFSGGIRAEGIQHNFEVLEEQIARERISVTGHGVSSGLDIVAKEFELTITEGSLIATDGREVYLDEIVADIPLPDLIDVQNELYTVQTGGRIVLPHVPYCTHQLSAVDKDSLYSSIKIVDYTNSAVNINYRNVVDNVIIVDVAHQDKLVRVSYSYTLKRYDTVFINKNKEIEIHQGTPSSSPSIMIPNESMYILGYLEINPYTPTDDGKKIATLTVKKDLRSLRNIYTDKDNRLFICGIPFDDLQIIHMTRPEDPFINQLWYDISQNILKVWREVDGIEQWISVNTTTFKPAQEVKMWVPDEIYDPALEYEKNPKDGRIFIFNATTDLNMHFIPNRNELQVHIDQSVLHFDQYDELTVDYVLENPELKQTLIDSYGYTKEWLESANERYENTGIGFILGSPLDKQCYIEAIVTQRAIENPLTTRFQRSATFSESDFFRASNKEKEFTIKSRYRFGENQIDIYLNGSKLTKDIDYIEGVDADYGVSTAGKKTPPKKGSSTNRFTIKTTIPDNSVIAYKTNVSIYSYDHIEELVGGLSTRLDDTEEIANQAKSIAEDVQTSTLNAIGTINDKVSNLEEKNLEHDNFIKRTDKIGENNLASDILNKLPKGVINLTVIKNENYITVDGISVEDFVMVVDTSKTQGNNILRRMDGPGSDGDYLLEAIAGSTRMSFKTPNTVSDGAQLYISGIRFK